MRMKQQIKSAIKHIRIKYVNFRRNQVDLKMVNKQIQDSIELIPQLTAQQKNEIIVYWSKYKIKVPLQWHRLIYGKTGVENPGIVPEPVFQQMIKPCMNNHHFAGIWSDKAYIDYFIRGVKTVRSVVRNVNGRFLNEEFDLISKDEVISILDKYDVLVIKPSVYTDTGKGVKLLKKPYDLYQIDEQYCKNYVIQIPLRQHPEIAKLNASSINTIRVNSVLFETEAHVMSAFIKVGQLGEFADNHGKDRYFIGINEDGTYGNYAINHDLQKFDHIPSNYDFAGQKVPGYEKVCRMVERAHQCIPHFGFAFWDICVNEMGEPVVVEVNLRYPDTVIPQVSGVTQGFLGKYAEDILEYINTNIKGI